MRIEEGTIFYDKSILPVFMNENVGKLRDCEVNNKVNPLMVLNELKLMTIESKSKDDQLIYQNNCN